MTRLTDAELAQIEAELEGLYVPHPWGDEGMRALNELRVDGRGATTAKGLIINGEAGTGKTAVFCAWMQHYPLAAGKPADHRPIAYAKIIGGRGEALSYRSIAKDILAAFGDRVVGIRETQSDLVERILSRARDQRTEVLAIDEAHLMLRSSMAGEFSKSLMNEAPFALVFIGDETIMGVYDTNGSFERRIDEIVCMKTYEWTSTEDRRALRKILRQQDRQLPFQSGLEAFELAGAIVSSARGNLGRQSRLLRKAFAHAVRRGASQIEWRHLELVHDRIDPRPKHRARNPFRRGPAATTLDPVSEPLDDADAEGTGQ